MIERDRQLTVRADSRDAAARWFRDNYGIDAEPVPCGSGLWTVPSPAVREHAEREGIDLEATTAAEAVR